MRVLSIVSLLVLFGSSVAGQRICDTDSYIKKHFTQEPVINYGVRPLPTFPARDTVSGELITIPVVVHLLFNSAKQQISDAQILSQLEVLNRDYRMLNVDKGQVPDAFKKYAADTRIVFCLAKVDPKGRPTSGIVKKYTGNEFFIGDDGMKFASMGGSDAWDCKRYLNIWVCDLFGRSLGYATPPGGDPLRDGVVIAYDVFGTTGTLRQGFEKGRTGTHEIAHWLGLKHIWGEEDCGDDGIFDTPKQKSYNFGCPSFPSISTCQANSNGDMFMNFMDLTDDACMQMFTAGQKNKMRALFALGGQRNSILLSYQCDSTLASGAALPQDSMPVPIKPISVKLFPNPVVSELQIDGEEAGTMSGEMASLYTSTGRLIKKYKLQSNKEKISLQGLVPGLYILKIGEGGRQVAYKVIKI